MANIGTTIKTTESIPYGVDIRYPNTPTVRRSVTALFYRRKNIYDGTGCWLKIINEHLKHHGLCTNLNLLPFKFAKFILLNRGED